MTPIIAIVILVFIGGLALSMMALVAATKSPSQDGAAGYGFFALTAFVSTLIAVGVLLANFYKLQ